MTDEYTTGNWSLAEGFEIIKVIEGSDGTQIILLECSDDDARRIVACVNACEGIPTEVLESGRAVLQLLLIALQ